MAAVRIGPGGDVEVLAAPMPEEIVEAKAALDRVIKALTEVAVERDWAERRAGLLDGGPCGGHQGAEACDDHDGQDDVGDLPS